jgi:hypothetical protein
MFDSVRRMTRRLFLKTAAAAAGLTLLGVGEAGCSSGGQYGPRDLAGDDLAGQDLAGQDLPPGCSYGYGYGYGWYGSSYGYGYGYGCHGPMAQNDMVLDRVARAVGLVARRGWPVGRGARFKLEV